MAQTTSDDTDAFDHEYSNPDVEIYYTRFGASGMAREIARDIRTFGDADLIDEDAFFAAYLMEANTSLDLTDADISDYSAANVLEHIYMRLQGGRVDSQLEYDGSEQRSMMTGDIVVLDGFAYLAGHHSWEALGELDYVNEVTREELNFQGE